MDKANNNLVQEKACTKCGEVKPRAEFPKHAAHRDGMGSQCKVCKRLVDAEYRLRNPEKNKEDYRKIIAANPNYHAEQYAKNREYHLARVKQYQKDNPEKRMESHRRFRENNPDYYREWPKRDPEKTKARSRKKYDKVMSTPKGRLENSFRVGVHKGLTKGAKAGRSTFKLLGYSSSDLKRHLENLFLDGMSWSNYGQWHVDHETPVSAFNYETPDDIDFKRCWALTNLRPMWAKANMSKGAKLTKPFQPSLLLTDTTTN